MSRQTSNASRAGGAIIAFSILIGTLIGAKLGQSSIGILAGTVLGVAIAVALYLFDRKRDRQAPKA